MSFNNSFSLVVLLKIFMLLTYAGLFSQNTASEIERELNQKIPENLLWMPSTKIETGTKLQVGLKRTGNISFKVLEYNRGVDIKLETIIPVETYDGRLDFKVDAGLFVSRHHEDFSAKFNIRLVTTLTHNPSKLGMSTIGFIDWESKPYIDVSGVKIRFSTLAEEQIINQLEKQIAEFEDGIRDMFN